METNTEISRAVSKNQQHQRKRNIKNRAHGHKTQDRRRDDVGSHKAADQPSERGKEQKERNQQFGSGMADGRLLRGDRPQR